MRRLLSLLALIVCLGQPAAAQVPFGPPSTVRETLEIGTSTNEIAITSDFRGADLTVFGALNNADELLLAIGQYDIIVTLEGPRDSATVRRKERVFGIWMNTRSMSFEHVPMSYSMAGTRDIETISNLPALNQLGIGISHMRLTPIGYVGNASNLGEFREAFRRLKLSSGLFQHETSGVRFVSPSLFRATLRLPANIPDGVHTVHAYLFKGGEFLVQRELPLRVVKTGLEQTISTAAHESPFSYGILCVLIALITGWSASLLFRKD